jgi:apolipoprotein D and lipocalin family protein
MKVFAVLCLVLTLASCGSVYRDRSVGMSSMAVFDPQKYAGVWYEVASFPTPFQAGCQGTKAEYAPLTDGSLSVKNTCQKNGALSVIEGRADVVGPGRLSVRLQGVPVSADYWVLWVDEGYRTAVVGVPSGRAGWILNRTPSIPADRLSAAQDVLAFNGYDLTELQWTEQGAQ